MSNMNTPAPAEFGIESKRAAQIQSQFEPMLAKMAELEESYNAIQAEAKKGITEEITAKAKDLRLQYVKIRTATAAIHKEQKAFYLAAGRYVDAWKNTQKFAAGEIEKALSHIENHFERLEQERKEKLRLDRWGLLQPYKDEEPAGLTDMDSEVFDAYLTIAKQQHADRIEAEQRAQIEAEQRALANKRERDILHLRNFWPEEMPDLGTITAETFENLVKGCQAREKEYIAEQERIARERAELERKAEAERKSREAERKAAEEREKKLRDEADAKLKAAKAKAEKERQEASRIERERIEAERKEQERLEAEKAAKEAAKRAKQPDAIKLKEMAAHRPEWPELKSDDAKWIADEYQKLLDKAEKWVSNQIEKKL